MLIAVARLSPRLSSSGLKNNLLESCRENMSVGNFRKPFPWAVLSHKTSIYVNYCFSFSWTTSKMPRKHWRIISRWSLAGYSKLSFICLRFPCGPGWRRVKCNCLKFERDIPLSMSSFTNVPGTFISVSALVKDIGKPINNMLSKFS